MNRFLNFTIHQNRLRTRSIVINEPENRRKFCYLAKYRVDERQAIERSLAQTPIQIRRITNSLSRRTSTTTLTTMSNSSTSSTLQCSDKLEPELQRGLDCWSVFSPASGYMPQNSLNLGQGFMNWSPPKFLKDAATASLQDISANHYSIPRGRINLRKAISKLYSPSFNLDRPLDFNSEIVISAGANFGIYCSIMGFCSKDDEVILIEPFFDQYIRNITFSGGKPVFVPLRPPANSGTRTVSSKDWKLDIDELKAAITPKSKIIILNTPHNPVGKVFTADELQAIGKVADENNLLIIADEVYDCLTFNEPHIRIASLSKSFWNRTITIGSAGKSFAATGWRIGWCIGPAELLNPVLAAMTRTTFCSVSPLQEALATGFEIAQKEDFFEIQRKQYEERKDVLLQSLDQLGLPYVVPDGSYFVLVETSKIKIPNDFEVLDLIKSRARDWHMCWFFAKIANVVCIPPSDFYSPNHVSIGENYVRIAFCKDIDTLKQAGKQLQKLQPYIT